MNDFYAQSVELQIEDLEDLARVALQSYDGEFSELEVIKYRENAIFSVRQKEGPRFALRIHRAAYHCDAALASELDWMRGLAEAGIPVPEILPNSAGSLLTLAETPRVPEVRRIDLLHWVSGEPLTKLEQDATASPIQLKSVYHKLGALMASIHNHGSQWPIPNGFKRHDWFAGSLVGNEPLWGPFWNLPSLTDDQKQLLLEARQQGSAALANHPQTNRNSGLIHADLIADNVMIDGDTLQPLDFDDAGFGWHMFEIATALYFLSERDDFPQLRDAVFAGYRTMRDLPDAEVAALPLFLMLRATTYLGWVATRSETETARELTPDLIRRACNACRNYQDGTVSPIATCLRWCCQSDGNSSPVDGVRP